MSPLGYQESLLTINHPYKFTRSDEAPRRLRKQPFFIPAAPQCSARQETPKVLSCPQPGTYAVVPGSADVIKMRAKGTPLQHQGGAQERTFGTLSGETLLHPLHNCVSAGLWTGTPLRGFPPMHPAAPHCPSARLSGGDIVFFRGNACICVFN